MNYKLNHLASYIPHGVHLMNKYGRWHHKSTDNYWVLYDMLEYKMVLKPISTFEIKEEYGYPNKEMFYEDVKNRTVSVKIWNEMLGQHIDVFNLIPNGLAIDINTLPK